MAKPTRIRGRPRETLSKVQQQAIDWIYQGKAKGLGRLGVEVGKMLAELAVEIADAKLEAKHWKQSFEVVRDELKVMAACVIHKQGGRLVLTKADYQKTVGLELYCGDPDDDGTRVYELRTPAPKKSGIDDAVNRIIRPH